MGHRFPYASLAPFGFAVEAVKIIGNLLKFGFGRAAYQQLVQTASDQADEFKADMSGDLLTYLSAAGG